MQDYTREVGETFCGIYEEPMNLGEYVDAVFEFPSIASYVSKCLLRAIESMGTRQAAEQGVEKQRHRLFDDPTNNGEHAVLGNTEVLNVFVGDLRTIVAGHDKAKEIVWFDGLTATGKSELKRCLINGLREYLKTDTGRRYIVERNVVNADDTRGLSYSGEVDTADGDQYEGLVQSHPLLMFPAGIRKRLLADLNNRSGDHILVDVDEDLNPFCLEAYTYLEKGFRRAGKTDLFGTATDPEHLRVKNYVVDVDRGVDVLHSEDDGSPEERLAGPWMSSIFRGLNSRGRENSQAFSYDDVLPQGNGLLIIIEDAIQYVDLLQRLLNVPNKGHAKLDRDIRMDTGTQLVIISSLGLDVELSKYADRNGRGPLKTLERRLSKHEFRYLTNLLLEAKLIHHKPTSETSVWTDDPEVVADRTTETVTLDVCEGPGEIRTHELVPYTVEAAALHSAVAHLDDDDVPRDPDLKFDLADKALLFDRDYLQVGGQRRGVSAFEFVGDAEGIHGIPVAFTRDVIADLLHDRINHRYPGLNVSSVVTLTDMLDKMVAELSNAPMSLRAESPEYKDRITAVESHIFDQQEADVFDALLADKGVERETVEECVKHVYTQTSDGQIETERGPIDPDPLLMRLFETEYLGRFSPDGYEGNRPSKSVGEFRNEKVITALSCYAWENHDGGFTVSDVDFAEIPVIRMVLEVHDWEGACRLFTDLNLRRWDNPSANIETVRVKARTIGELVDRGYTAASAELTSRTVMKEVNHT